MLLIKTLKYFLHLLFLLLIILPISEIFSVPYEESDGIWEKQYIFNNIYYAFIFIPMIISWYYLQFSRDKDINIMVKMILFTPVLIGFGTAIMGIIFVSPDYIPSFGILILLFLFPCLIAYHLITQK